MRALSCLLLLACSGPPPALIARVLDPDGQPIQRAEVSTEPHTEVVLSNSSGIFAIHNVLDQQGHGEPIPSGEYLIRIAHIEYQPQEIKVQLQEGQQHLPDVILQPKQGPVIKDGAPIPLADPKIDPGRAGPPVGGPP